MSLAYGVALLALAGCAGAPNKTPQPAPPASAPPRAAEPALPELILVPGATFLMGDDQNPSRPKHEETVAPFELGRTEVTTAAYRRCVAAGACTAANTTDQDLGRICTQFLAAECNFSRSDREEHPINCVSLRQAQDFCQWRGQRLPTEPEWELAARGPEHRQYPWGSSSWTPAHANLCDKACSQLRCPFTIVSDKIEDGFLTTSPVESHPLGATPSGILDMAGNVLEWTTTIDHGSALEPTPKPGNICRGDAWTTDLLFGFRAEYSATETSPALGFRCAREAQGVRQ
jgi:eukaryotic-like serine/threonine-protein kinase